MTLIEKIDYLRKWCASQPDIRLAARILDVCDAARASSKEAGASSSPTQQPTSNTAPLFRHGAFTSHSGLRLPDKIDCDALSAADWATNAAWVASRLTFGRVIGIPSGGTPFAKALEPYATEGPTLIVDDVLTTGRSMEEARREHPHAIGVVLFSRTPNVPGWITARFVEAVLPEADPGQILSNAEALDPRGVTMGDVRAEPTDRVPGPAEWRTPKPPTQQPVECSPLLPPWFDIATAPKNGATILGMYAAKESYLGDDGPRHHIVRWFDSEQAFCTTDSRGDPEKWPTISHWQPLTYLHALYGHTVYPVPGAYYAYDLPAEWKAIKRESQQPDGVLPCPFCGSAPETGPHRFSPEATLVWCRYPCIAADLCVPIEAWNTRPMRESIDRWKLAKWLYDNDAEVDKDGVQLRPWETMLERHHDAYYQLAGECIEAVCDNARRG